MPKPATFPYLIDEGTYISTKKLKEWGYFKGNAWRTGTITWSRNGVKTSSIGIEVTMRDKGVSEIRLNYTCNEESYNYSVALESLPSNIGEGRVWYFICRFTGKRCRKLHLINGKFKHRTALSGGMYSKQTQSKKWREIEKVYGCYFDSDKNYEQLYKKHFKKTYNGKPTKKYKKLMREIQKADRFTAGDIERLFLMK